MHRAIGANVTSPGQAPRVSCQTLFVRPEGAAGPRPFRAAPQSMDLEPRGVAPGWSPPALSALEDIDFPEQWKTFGSRLHPLCAFMRWHLVEFDTVHSADPGPASLLI